MKDEQVHPSGRALGRRDLMKMGAGVAMTTLSAKGLLAEAAEEKARGPQDSISGPTADTVETGAGWKNDAGRASGNGPMDDTSRQLVSYVSSFSESHLTDPLVAAVGNSMVDTMASLISGFESEPARISARIARTTQCDLKSTVLGYGVTTSPDLATFANSSMVRHTDFNDMEPPSRSHSSVMIPGILAIGEALHSTGPQVMVAVTLAYEILFAMGDAAAHRKIALDGPYEGMATALAVGKLMGLNEDKLANALSLALVPHLPMSVSHTGALSMWKGCHSPMGVRNGVFAALLAREGMTGPSQPFEGRNGLWDTITGPFELHLPVRSDGKMIVQIMGFKRFPAEGSTQGILDQVVPRISEWTKVEDIASIRVEMPFSVWQEVGDPPKWDPRNRETADHSYAYVTAVGLIDGDVYMSSFTPKRYLEDTAVRQLMEKITVRANPEFQDLRKRITVRTKAGAELVKDLYDVRPMSHEDIIAKFNRVCGYMSVSNGQRDRALATWSNLRGVHDIAEPIRDLAKFGKPVPL